MKQKICGNCFYCDPPNPRKLEFSGWCKYHKEVIKHRDETCSAWIKFKYKGDLM